jgi:multicomponent Na+:H+ antiporter subunit B
LRERYHNTIVDGVARLLVPFMQIFALYVITHGHYGPGGGFQGGVILAAALMLLRLTMGKEEEDRFFSTTTAAVLASIGILIYASAGLLPLFFGGAFLDYGRLPIPGMADAALRSLGILIVESGVGLVVWGTLVIIFDYLIGNEP